jgi:flavin-dependent dehydrogenase
MVIINHTLHYLFNKVHGGYGWRYRTGNGLNVGSG